MAKNTTKTEEKRKPGRPFGTFKYDSAEELQKDIDDYFASCDPQPLLDDEGFQITDKNGNPMFTQGKPYTLTGLALALNISTRTLSNYSTEDYGDVNYFHIVNRARQKCLDYAENRLYDKDGVQGAKFYLTNNAERMGGLRYAERQEVSMDVAPITFIDNLGDD
jgi:hypothetical protein